MFGGFLNTAVSEDELLSRFNGVLSAIRQKAPKAKVYLVEYLTILGPDVKPGTDVSFAANKVQSHRAVAATLQRATARAAKGKDWVEIVPVAEASLRHGLGSREPFVNGASGSFGNGISWVKTSL